MQKNYLVVSALGEDRPGLVDAVSQLIRDTGCSVGDSRMSVLGGDFAMIFMVEGRWNELAKLESSLPAAGRRLGLDVQARRTRPRPPTADVLPYSVEVVCVDHSGIIHQLGNFFASRDINIRDLTTTSYAAAHTRTPMFQLQMTIDVAASLHIARLREEFMDFCDQLNLDAIIEPLRH
ncbi:glycine cleavage system protein R [Spiribacter vilamensis]|uniref:Glycine cleavage system transcriptional repressor n=1 Tax=Spiribacter vilamensis TaxID=531306 RepID=A0A4Q8D1C7_9GAMM|nr:ACT domain-containing protein [Spiribacter vilamensis]RZU99050.1 glycine cleavage system transcriptional repressor [Spiribacter vilamensis]TVO61950.1 glycine cleavage system protein R [Spiribacter vilamensis]